MKQTNYLKMLLPILVMVSLTTGCGSESDDEVNTVERTTNSAPIISSTALTDAIVGTEYSYQFEGSDPDIDDNLTMSVAGLVSWLSFDSTTGILSGTPTSNDVGPVAVTLTLFDGQLEDNQTFTIEVQEEETVPFDLARAGNVDGVSIWQLPDAPSGTHPDQSWLAVGSAPDGDIYISGHDHTSNSMLYRLYQEDDVLRWVGDAREASMAADNWQAGESAEKFHTRPIFHDNEMYVATLDKSSLDNAFMTTRGFHWYSYDILANEFNDLSASEENGVGAETLQIVTIQVDPVNNVMYGMSTPENKIVSYDIAQGITTVLGNPAEWEGYFYSNRFMWVDSRGRLYFTGGSERGQWNQGEERDVLDHVWYYDPDTGLFGELTDFALEGANALEIGQWDREHKNLYASDDQGHIYRFTDEGAQWSYLGRPGFSQNAKTWVFNLSADGEKIYIANSDFDKTFWEFDIATGASIELHTVSELDNSVGSENFMTGYDTWDKDGSFYTSVFSMYDNNNVYLLGYNPVRAKVAKGILAQLVEVTASQSENDVLISRTGATTESLDVIYEVRRFSDNSDLVETIFGQVSIPAGHSSVTLNAMNIWNELPTMNMNSVLVVSADGNDYVLGLEREAIILGENPFE